MVDSLKNTFLHIHSPHKHCDAACSFRLENIITKCSIELELSSQKRLTCLCKPIKTLMDK